MGAALSQKNSGKERIERFFGKFGGGLEGIFFIVSAAISVTAGIFCMVGSAVWTMGDSVSGLIMLVLILVFVSLFALSEIGIVGDPIGKLLSGLASAGGVALGVISVLILYPESDHLIFLGIVSWFYFAFSLMVISEANISPVRSYSYTVGLLGLFIPALYPLDEYTKAGVLGSVAVYSVLALFFGGLEYSMSEKFRNIFRALTAVSIGIGSFLFYGLLEEISISLRNLTLSASVIGIVAFFVLAVSIRFIQEE